MRPIKHCAPRVCWPCGQHEAVRLLPSVCAERGLLWKRYVCMHVVAARGRGIRFGLRSDSYRYGRLSRLRFGALGLADLVNGLLLFRVNRFRLSSLDLDA